MFVLMLFSVVMGICGCLLLVLCYFLFFKQKTAYEMRISDWSSDVCSSDLGAGVEAGGRAAPDDADSRERLDRRLVEGAVDVAEGRCLGEVDRCDLAPDGAVGVLGGVDVHVGLAGRLRGLGARRDRPSARFLGAAGEEGLEVEQRVAGAADRKS